MIARLLNPSATLLLLGTLSILPVNTIAAEPVEAQAEKPMTDAEKDMIEKQARKQARKQERKRTCKKVRMVGTHIPQKVCMRNSEWDRLMRESQEAARERKPVLIPAPQ